MSRFDKLLAAARRRGVDAVALVPGTNLRYITGVYYHPGERLSMAVFDTNGHCGFVMPAMDAARTAHTVTWRWIKGHAGHAENGRADALARAGMAPLKAG